MTWSRAFDEPIPLPDDRTLATLVEAGEFITALPKKEHSAPEWQSAMQALILALRWIDFNAEQKTLRVERALEITKKFGLRYKPPKTWRGKRTIALDDGAVALLLVEREKHQRLLAGIPDGTRVDLSLIRLPDDTLIFPAAPAAGENFDFTKPPGPKHLLEAIPPRCRCARVRRVRVSPSARDPRHAAPGQGRPGAHGGRTDRPRPGGAAAELCEAQAQTDDASVTTVINAISTGILGSQAAWVPFGSRSASVRDKQPIKPLN